MNIAFIPVRGGSKSIPLKNIKPFAGRPLVYWTVKAAAECRKIDKVFVATDCKQISDIVNGFQLSKVRVIERSHETATDAASTESAMLEFAENHEFDNIALIQATSPLLTSDDLSRGFSELEIADSVLSVVRQRRFLWQQEQYATPINYDYSNRPRRQDFDGFLVENGAFYITRREALLRTMCRLSGNVRVLEMPEESYFEIDEPSDWVIAEQLLMRHLTDKTRVEIKMLLTDCDGTLTDGGMYYSKDGDVMKKFNTRDGVGLRLLKDHGIITGIITGENSEIVRKRGEKLGVDEILLGVSDKVRAIKSLSDKYNIGLPEIAYIGDDLNDYDAIRLCGFKACPADAAMEIRELCDYVSSLVGGHGAVRDVCEQILRYQDEEEIRRKLKN
ncbi:acylneuraminate cytidylyltransferase [Synergistales bacterium]|nr:acylneuraminate cytidylyltransferase [Synergistales bacterium]